MRKPLRITTVRGKWAYAVVGWCVVGLGVRAIIATTGNSLAWVVFSTVADLALYLVGARIFRGADELRDPPRPWWRMTARAKLSRRLGILFGFLTVMTSLSLFVGNSRHPLTETATASAVAGAIEFLVLTVLYVTSGRRLKRLETQQPTPEKVDPALSAPFDDGWPRAR
ncbi:MULTISPECIES: hypothetical protein [unclassified Leifsonia]|uniref:hypothetical protein n=1 Tax=unclassified Leifsonia TaxID=2663824 RepID=UPI000A198426|nr:MULTISPECIES: hypothetical protein [unclassified Leifsonia]QIZ98483.1 hypothetical protein HF024_08140 [Leifsonia sp. PS1209]